MDSKITDYVDQTRKQAAWYRVRVGSRKSPETVGLLATRAHMDIAREKNSTGDFAVTEVHPVARMAEEMMDTAEGAGWGTDHPTLRVHAYDKDGKQLRGLQVTLKISDDGNTGRTVREGAAGFDALCDALVRMADRLGTTVETQAQIIEDQADTIQALSDSNMTLKEQLVQAEADVIDEALRGAIEAATASEDSGVKSMIEKLLEQTIGSLLPPPDDDDDGGNDE